MKRVCCLYRVSTKKQVDKNVDDIPAQRIACRAFCESKPDWMIVKEYSEKGVSGYKVSANDRDAIQDLKEAALKHQFDVLLVFMFDRIGRIDDETPFIVEWFVKNGVEVWSVNEGEQRFDTHVDKLMNYLRFWQASGESAKTSIRIKNSLGQMELSGMYTGGPIKYGYHLVDSGLVNKKGQPMKKYEIDEEEADVIHLIDEMTLHKGYGSWRMADFLNRKGYRTHTGNEFTSVKVNRILRDTYYCGYLPNGQTSEALQLLQIRDKETFRQIQEILNQRNGKYEEKRHIALQTKGQSLLSGNIFCAHCGGRLTTIRYRDRRVRADGSIYSVDQLKYCCYHKTRKLCKCDGQTTYHASRVDGIVLELMENMFKSLTGAPEEEKLEETLKHQLSSNKTAQKRIALSLEQEKGQLVQLQLEIGKALTGNSVYTSDDLSMAIQSLKGEIAKQEEELEALQVEETVKRDTMKRMLPTYERFKSWAEEFETASNEEKKMIACQLFKRIEVGRGYKIKVQMNMTYEQFVTDWDNPQLSQLLGK